MRRGGYLDRRENILLVGGSGSGKTHVATALGIAACNQGKRVRFYRVTELITALMETFRCVSRPYRALGQRLKGPTLFTMKVCGGPGGGLRPEPRPSPLQARSRKLPISDYEPSRVWRLAHAVLRAGK